MSQPCDPQLRWWKSVFLPAGVGTQQIQVTSLGYGRPFWRIHGIVVSTPVTGLTITNTGISPVNNLTAQAGTFYPCNFVLEPGAIFSAVIPGAVPVACTVSILCERLTPLDESCRS